MIPYEIKNSMLVKEFDKYIGEHPEFADNIQENALVAMLLEGDDEFSQWSRHQALNMAEKNQPIQYVKIKKLRPIQSRIEDLALETEF
jgi:hypothetical protein